MNDKLNSHSPFYLCTGFHRSGTSLIAQSLAKGGMHMGDELMGASFSNPLGHVEDIPAVRLHDKIFEINGTDWRFHHHSPLVKPVWFENYLSRYVDERGRNTALSGVKDPRACFFLDNWQVAVGDRMRYVLVYRHWSTAANSLLSRASRHLINGTAPISANKVNLSFFQTPTFAFDMWEASNAEILSFYKKYPDRCLLISQEAYVDQNIRFEGRGQKIGLDGRYFDHNVVKSSLTTGSVPASVLSMLPKEQVEHLDNTWQQLQDLADVPSPTTPMVNDDEPLAKTVNWFVDKVAPNQSDTVPSIPNVNQRFDLSSLSWQEALGFLSRIPEQEVSVALFDNMMARPFTHAGHYDTLAKIAHKNQDLITTKLCKMRGMQAESNSWQPDEWVVYTEGCKDWLCQVDSELPKENPYSLLPKDSSSITSKLVADLFKLKVTQISLCVHSDSHLYGRDWLSGVLLHRAFLQQEYRTLAVLAASQGWHSLREFCLFKALRSGMHFDLIMEFGDLYLSQGMTVKAFQCFEAAFALAPGSAALLCRLGDVMLEMGDIDKASGYFKRAKANAPQHPAVLRTGKRLNMSLTKQHASIQVAPTLSEGAQQNVMPLVESYEQVLTILHHDEQAGIALDRYNMRMSFIMRDNVNWLKNGLAILPQNSRGCLVEKVYGHWLKLWPKEALDTELGLPLTLDYQPSVASNNRGTSDTRILICLSIDDIANAPELLSFICHCPINADLRIVCSMQDESWLREHVIRYGLVKATFLRDKPDNQYLSEYDLVCYLNTPVVGLNNKPVNILLQQLFALVGDRLVIDRILGAFERDDTLGLVVASYHPDVSHQIGWGSNFEQAKHFMQNSNMLLPKSVDLFPFGGMYWARPKALSGAFSANLQKESELVFLKLLPTFVSQAGFTTSPTHLLR
jgi:tetratricopeptide (TPR) repeat protein